MPIRTPVVIEIDRKTWLVQEYGLDCAYLLLGERFGLVIDTGCGRMNLRKLAQRLLEGRPYEVALTHGHSHHAGGAGCFRQVSCAEPLGRPVTEEPVSPDFLPGNCPVAGDAPQVLPLYTGTVFDLGNREVRCIRTPGHSEGSCCFYDPQSGILFSGDALSRELRVSCVSDALVGLMRLKRLAAGINRIYPGHVDHCDYRALPASVLEDAIGACRAALAPDSKHYRKGEQICFRSVTLKYDALWAESEPHSPYPPGI